jgi:hypothetical protein
MLLNVKVVSDVGQGRQKKCWTNYDLTMSMRRGVETRTDRSLDVIKWFQAGDEGADRSYIFSGFKY